MKKGTLTNFKRGKYVGELKNSKPNGQGTLTHPTGEKYVGQWKDDFIEEWG